MFRTFSRVAHFHLFCNGHKIQQQFFHHIFQVLTARFSFLYLVHAVDGLVDEKQESDSCQFSVTLRRTRIEPSTKPTIIAKLHIIAIIFLVQYLSNFHIVVNGVDVDFGRNMGCEFGI